MDDFLLYIMGESSAGLPTVLIMKMIIDEYGGTIITAIVAMLILGILLALPIGGQKGLLGAVGASVTIGADMSPGMSEADRVAERNRTTYEITQTSDGLKVGTKTPLSFIFQSTDNTAIFSVAWAEDNKKNDAMENGSITYDRKTHSITVNKRGIYCLHLRASGKQLMRQTFDIVAI